MHFSISFLSALGMAALTLSSAQAEDAMLSGADMQARIVGNTMVGIYDDAGGQWREYYDPSGEIRGTDEDHGAYSARYEIRQDFMCFDYPWDGADWCSVISIDGDNLTFYKDGKPVTTIRNTQLLPGNPHNP